MTAETSREKLAVACLRRLTQVNMWSEKQRDQASEDVRSTLEKIDRLPAKPADDVEPEELEELISDRSAGRAADAIIKNYVVTRRALSPEPKR